MWCVRHSKLTTQMHRETRGLFVIELLGNWYIIREISWHNILGYVLWLHSATPFSLSCFYLGGYMKSREWLSSGLRLPFFTFYKTARLLLFSFFFALSSLDKQLLLFLSLSLAIHGSNVFEPSTGPLWSFSTCGGAKTWSSTFAGITLFIT